MTLKNNAKFEEKPICCLQNDKNLVNFDPSTQISKTCTVICPFCAKEELCLMTMKSHAKFEGKLACGLENDMKHLGNFHQNI